MGSLRSSTFLDESLWEQRDVVYARAYRNKVVYIGMTDGYLKKRIRYHLGGIQKFERGSAPTLMGEIGDLMLDAAAQSAASTLAPINCPS
jgi:hypothetical protein